MYLDGLRRAGLPAYQVFGQGQVNLVIVPGFISNVEENCGTMVGAPFEVCSRDRVR